MTMDASQFSEARVAEIVAGVVKYMRGERALYLRASEPLPAKWRTSVEAYFPSALLDTVRTVVLDGARIPPPPFYAEALALSGGHFPDFVHLPSVTYIDLIVFNEAITPPTLFHALVHAQQIAILGVEQYFALYVRGFVSARSWLRIPLEEQAYKLQERFLTPPAKPFSVQEEVHRWATEHRFE
jgi:hypothetical protein